MNKSRQPLWPAVIWGAALIILGVMVLLGNLGVLPSALFWPLLLVLLGLGIIFSSLLGGGRAARVATHHRVALPEGLQAADIALGFGVGDLDVRPAEDATTLAEGHFETGKRLSLEIAEGRARVRFGSLSGWDWFAFWRTIGDAEVELNPQVPLNLCVEGRLGDVRLDLSRLQVRRLRVPVAIGDIRIRFPRAAGSTEATIGFSLGDLILSIPAEVGARIEVPPGFLGSLSFDRTRFQRRGYTYVSENLESAENHLEVRISAHLGDIRIRTI